MLKKVALTNIHNGRAQIALVDTNTDDKALIGAGKTDVETAQVSDITGLDESIPRMTGPKKPQTDRMALFNGLAKCFDRNIPIIKSFELQANRVKSPRYRGAIAEIAENLRQGEKMSDAMARQSDLFGEDIIALIRNQYGCRRFSAGSPMPRGRPHEFCASCARASFIRPSSLLWRSEYLSR
ncbi:MAG: type II secretion system F family protein [Verrucomicrobiales bacterium]